MDINTPLITGVKLTSPSIEQPIIENIPLLTTYTGENIPRFSEYKLKDYEKYLKYGVDPVFQDINKERAIEQPWTEQALALTNQAVVGEIIGGIIMSVGALADLISPVQESEQDFHNEIYDIGNSISEWTRETTPIYQTGERFGDSGWWFQNGVSIVSSLSMMLPGMAVAKGAKLLTGLAKFSTTLAEVIETSAGALAMRHAENFREASGVFDNIYKSGIDKGLSESEARKVAADAASTTYSMDYLNTAFDFIQLASVLRPFKGLTRNLGRVPYKVAKAEGKLPTSKLGRAGYWITDSGKGIPEQMSEGVEEVVNAIAQYEGEREGNIALGIQNDDNTTLGQRIGDYLGRPETVDSFIWGTLGGVAFKQVAKATGFDETSAMLDRKLSEVANRENIVKRYAEVAKAISTNGQLKDSEGKVVQDFANINDDAKTSLLKEVLDSSLHNLGINASTAGNVDRLLEWLDDKSTHKLFIENGLSTEESINEDIKHVKDKVTQAEDLYKKHYTRLYENPVSGAIKQRLLNESINTDYRLQSNLEKIKELESEYITLYNKDGIVQTNLENPNLNPTLKLEGIKVAQMILTKELADAISDDNKDVADAIRTSISSLNNKEKAAIIEKPVDIKGIDERLIDNLAYQETLKEQNQRLITKLGKVDSKENIQKTKEQVAKDEAEMKKTLQENKNKLEEKAKKDRINKAAVDKWNKVINSASSKYLDTVLDKIDAEGIVTPEQKAELAVNINKRREALTQLEVEKAKRKGKGKVTDEVEDEVSEREKAEKDAFESLTAEDERGSGRELDSELSTKTKLDPDHIDDGKNKDIKDSLDGIDESLKDSNGAVHVDSTGEITYLNNKIANGSNTLAHQDRAYERVVGEGTVTYVDVTDELNEEVYLPVISPNKFKEGDEVELRVEDDDSIEIYNPRVEGKEKITWGAFKVGLDPNSQEYVDNIPIRVYVNGKPVNLHYHSTSWMNNENIAGTVESDIINTRKIRQALLKVKTFKAPIIKATNGILFKTKDGRQITLEEAFNGDTPTIGTVTSDGSIKIAPNKFVDKLINKDIDKLVPGSTVFIAKVKNGFLAIPVSKTKVGSGQIKVGEKDFSIRDTILTAIDIHLEQNAEKAKAILKETGYDIRTAAGLEGYLSMFIHFYNTGKSTLTAVLKGLPKGSNVRYLAIRNGVLSLYDGKYADVNGAPIKLGLGEQSKRKEFMEALANSLPNFYLNTSLDALNSKKSTVVLINTDGTISDPITYRTFLNKTTTTNIKGFKVDEGKNGEPIYSYTIQNVIRVNFDELFKEEPVESGQPVSKTTKPIQPNQESIDKSTEIVIEKLLGGFKVNDTRPNTKEGKRRNTRIKINSDGTKISFEGYIEGEPTTSLNPAYPRMSLEDFLNSEFYKNLTPESKEAFNDLIEDSKVKFIQLHEIRISKSETDAIGKGNSGVTISIHTEDGILHDINFASNTAHILVALEQPSTKITEEAYEIPEYSDKSLGEIFDEYDAEKLKQKPLETARTIEDNNKELEELTAQIEQLNKAKKELTRIEKAKQTAISRVARTLPVPSFLTKGELGGKIVEFALVEGEKPTTVKAEALHDTLKEHLEETENLRNCLLK